MDSRHKSDDIETYRRDVIVVGAGNAALTAALAAREAQASVLVLEAASKEDRGGNSRFSGGLFRFPHGGLESVAALVTEREWEGDITFDPYPGERYYDEAMSVADHRADATLLRGTLAHAYDTMAWMRDRGVRWRWNVGKNQNAGMIPAGGKLRLRDGAPVIAQGEGEGLVANLFAAAERDGVEIWYDAPGHSLITSGSAVLGVRVRTPERFIDVLGTVVLASGGFGSNPELRRRYLGPGWDLVKVRGTKYNMGTMLVQALVAGAQPVGHWGGCHASPIDADAPPTGDFALSDHTARYSYPFGITVNVLGRRFIDEGEDEHRLTYAKTGAAISAQPRGVAFQLFDQKTIHLLEPRYATGTPIEADTIPELAERCGIPVDALVDTIGRFNASTPEGPCDFTRNDGQATHGAPGPEKSNWSVPLDRPPYVVYKAACGLTFTYGGLKCDETSRVLDTTGRPMRGLYVAGEMQGGYFFHNYMAGAGLMRGAVYGRLAGAAAAAEALESTVTA